MQSMRTLVPAAFALAGICVSVPSASHADVGGFYQRKVVKIIVGASPGGGFDAYSRLTGRHMGKHIPGSPGAGSMKAVQSLKALPQDGTVIVAFNPGLVTQSLLMPAKVKFKFTEVAFVGNITADIRVCYMWGKTGVKDLKEMLARQQINFGATSTGVV